MPLKTKNLEMPSITDVVNFINDQMTITQFYLLKLNYYHISIESESSLYQKQVSISGMIEIMWHLILVTNEYLFIYL